MPGQTLLSRDSSVLPVQCNQVADSANASSVVVSTLSFSVSAAEQASTGLSRSRLRVTGRTLRHQGPAPPPSAPAPQTPPPLAVLQWEVGGGCSARLHCHRWWRCLASRNLKIARQQKTRQWTRALGREKGATSALQCSFHPVSPKKVSQKVSQ